MATVLIVEDNEQNYILMESVIEMMGHDSIHARNGQEGLELADIHRPDLILLDLRLPLLSGWEVANILKNDQELHQIPVIAVSVLVNSSDQDRAFEAGCDGYISKPYSLDVMRNSIRQYID